ncbi:MAG: hypothetical protein K2L51_07230, partial [Clostridiales bacterium]|nr:hypothetical protein [Clostridiales bacterium]
REDCYGRLARRVTLANGTIAGSYVLTFDKTKLTSADIKAHTLKVTGTVNGVVFEKAVTFTLSVAGYTPTLELLRNGVAATDNRVLLSEIGNYTVALTDPLTGLGTGAVSVQFASTGFTGTQSGNVYSFAAFTGNVSAGGTVKVTVTALGVTFEKEMAISVVPAVQIGITAPAAGANGLGNYMLTGIPEGVAFASKAEIIAGGDLVTLTGADNSKTFTVAAKQNTAGGKAALKITVRITDTRFSGTEYAAEKTFTYAITVSGADKPDDTALTVTKTNETATGGKLAVTVAGYTPTSVSYAVTNGADYIRIDADGAYTYVKDTASAHTVKVTVTAVIRHSVYGDLVLTQEAEIIVPQKAARPELQDGDVTVRIQSGNAGTLTLNKSGIQKVVWLSESRHVTVTGDTFAFTDTQNFTLRVYYTITSGDWAGDAVYEKAITVAMPAFPTGTARVADGNITASVNGATVGAITCAATENGAYIVLTNGTNNGVWNYTLKNGAGGKQIVLSFSAQITSGDYSGYSVTWTQTFTAPAEPAPTVGYADATQSLTVSGLSDTAYTLSTTNEWFTLGENNVCVWKEDKKGDAAQLQTVSVTVTVTSGVYAGCTYACNVTVTVPAKTPAPDPEQGGTTPDPEQGGDLEQGGV